MRLFFKPYKLKHMKYLLTTLLTLFTVSAFTQTLGDKAVIVKGVTIEQVKTILKEQKYKLNTFHTKDNTIATTFKRCHKCDLQMQFNITVIDSVATIKGKWLSGDTRSLGSSFYNPAVTNEHDIEYAPRNPKTLKKLFNELERIAKLLSTTVTYM